MIGEEEIISHNWPSNGSIKFTDVECRYRDGLKLALNGTSFDTDGYRLFGIAGKSSSGKSTALFALSRLLELSSGKIEIDGVDISKIPLKKLRNNITVVSQHCTIFRETLKFNLDPTGKASDLEMEAILRKVGLEYLLERENPK